MSGPRKLGSLELSSDGRKSKGDEFDARVLGGLSAESVDSSRNAR